MPSSQLPSLRPRPLRGTSTILPAGVTSPPAATEQSSSRAKPSSPVTTFLSNHDRIVLANQRFNVNQIYDERLDNGPLCAIGIPRCDKAGNIFWIPNSHAAFETTGRVGGVTTNSAADARASEQEIR
jgi:hypothetical protein